MAVVIGSVPQWPNSLPGVCLLVNAVALRKFWYLSPIDTSKTSMFLFGIGKCPETTSCQSFCAAEFLSLQCCNMRPRSRLVTIFLGQPNPSSRKIELVAVHLCAAFDSHYSTQRDSNERIPRLHLASASIFDNRKEIGILGFYKMLKHTRGFTEVTTGGQAHYRSGGRNKWSLCRNEKRAWKSKSP